MMHQIILAGGYPVHTKEKLQELLPADTFHIRCVDTSEEYSATMDAEFLILRVFHATAADMDRNPGLKMILRWGVGTDTVDLLAAKERGILVTNTPGANSNAVAELTVMLMLAAGRKLSLHSAALSQQLWSRNTYLNESFCLSRKTVGIIGGGNIGRKTAALVHAFGAKIVYYDAFRLSEETETASNMKYMPLERLLRVSDIVSLHIPLTEQTENFMNAETFSLMKQGAVLINTARGGLIDEKAFLNALHSGRLSCAGLDAFREDPLPFDHPFYKEPRILLTPHIGGSSADISEEIIPVLAEDILAYSEGKMPPHLVKLK